MSSEKTIQTYTQLTNLFMAVAILSAIIFDRFEMVRLPAAAIGVGTAVAAIVLYFGRKD